jgi:hypothetical protein
MKGPPKEEQLRVLERGLPQEYHTDRGCRTSAPLPGSSTKGERQAADIEQLQTRLKEQGAAQEHLGIDREARTAGGGGTDSGNRRAEMATGNGKGTTRK